MGQHIYGFRRPGWVTCRHMNQKKFRLRSGSSLPGFLLIRLPQQIKRQTKLWSVRNVQSLLELVSGVSMNCRRAQLTPSTAYIAYDGDTEVGYAQPEFKFPCPHCSFHIKKDNLAVAKLAIDIARDPRNTDDLQKFGFGTYLP